MQVVSYISHPFLVKNPTLNMIKMGKSYFHSVRFKEKLALAYEMRQNPTLAEQRIKDVLLDIVLPEFAYNDALRFKTQYVIGGYIVDVFFPRLQLAFEVDGFVHRNTQEWDRQRDRNLKRGGIKVIRFDNDYVFDADFPNLLIYLLERRYWIKTTKKLHRKNSW